MKHYRTGASDATAKRQFSRLFTLIQNIQLMSCNNLPKNPLRQKPLLYKNHLIDLHYKSIGFKPDLLNRLLPDKYHFCLCAILIITAL